MTIPTLRQFLSTHRRWKLAGIGVAALLVLLLAIIAAFPFGVLRGTIAARLAAATGQPVSIGAVERTDRFGFTPTVVVRDIAVGKLARIDTVEVRFPVLPLLIGRFRPEAVTVGSGRLSLIRDADGNTNWSRSRDRTGGGDGPDLSAVTIRDLTVDYRDARRDRSVTVKVTADATDGVRATGRGLVRGSPVTVALSGPPVRPGRWPFRAEIAGPMLAMQARGTMDRPLDTGHMTLSATARADDLRYIDAIIEAGLFGSQPVRMRADDVRHDGPVWRVPRVAGTIGRSDFAGGLTVDKSSGRNVITGSVRSRQLDFGDFSSDEGLAQGAALERRIGLRVVPNMAIDLKSVRNTDGRIDFRAASVVSRKGPSAIKWLAGTVRVERQLLTAEPLAIGLAQGAIRGRAVVDQRGGAAVPLVTIDLGLRNSMLGALEESAAPLGGRADAVARLTGRGATVRAAVGNSDGRIGLVARGGRLPERLAAALGFDAGRALLAGKDDQAALRCIAVGVTVRRGRGEIDPLVIDTSLSQAKGTGTLTFPGEALALRLTGLPKQGATLRVPGSATVGGLLRAPEIAVSKETKSAGNILKAIGRAIIGKDGPRAGDADCDALAARALR